MRHLMPIVTPRLVLRPPTLGDLDSIQRAKEDAWPDLQRWMAWAFDNQRSRQAMEKSIQRARIARVNQESHWPGFIGSTGISSSAPRWILPMSQTSLRPDTGWRPNTPDRA